MYVPSHTLRLALLRVFTEAGERAGDGLSFPEMVRSWARTGLRDYDLRVAVRELLESGDLRSMQRNGVLGFALSTAVQHGQHRPDGKMQFGMAPGEPALSNAHYQPGA